MEKAIARPLGGEASMNKRTIHQFIHPDVLETCQLSMGMTILEEGSGWTQCHVILMKEEWKFTCTSIWKRIQE